VSPGTHVFTVKAIHSSGDLSPASNPVTVTVAPRGSDQTAPTAPQNAVVRMDEEAYDWVTSWEPSTDNVDHAPVYDVLQEVIDPAWRAAAPRASKGGIPQSNVS
jgi:hypothetical protein